MYRRRLTSWLLCMRSPNAPTASACRSGSWPVASALEAQGKPVRHWRRCNRQCNSLGPAASSASFVDLGPRMQAMLSRLAEQRA